MKPTFEPSRKLEIAYEREIRRIISKAILARRKGQSFEEWIAELRSVSRNDLFRPTAEKLARQMVKMVNLQNMQAWRAAAQWVKHSRLMYQLLQKELSGPIGAKYEAMIQANAQMIRSVPVDIAERLSARFAKAQQAGVRAETLARQMSEAYPELAGWKARLIARTEVAKASAALTEVRAREIGIGWAVWKTSRDGAVRRSHRNMEGVLFSWDDLPNPEAMVGEHSSLGQYSPGNAPNCRCSAFPLIALSDVQWPHRTYMQGSIVIMNRAQFAQTTGMLERIAA